MNNYPFNLIQHNKPPLKDKTILNERPFINYKHSFKDDAKLFVPGDSLETAINTAIAVGEPLLITGEPGTGKTQSAYYAAFKLDVEPVFHFQVKSDSTAKDLLYNFDMIKYFHDANIRYFDTLDKNYNCGLNKDDNYNINENELDKKNSTQNNIKKLDKKDYIEKRVLWLAFLKAQKENHSVVLLIDEIDKAPRDFPNDLLHELDKMEFIVKETEPEEKISCPNNLKPIVFITSNSERRLPEPFLRRCVYHHINFDDNLIKEAVYAREKEYKKINPNINKDFLDLAISRFIELREENLRKKPATGELLVWINVLAAAFDISSNKLRNNLSDLPYLGALIKDHQDIQTLKTRR